MYFWLGRCDREQAAFSVALQKLGRRCQILVFSYRTSPKTPLRYQARSCSFGTGLHQDPNPIPSCKRVVMLENTLALFLCREIGAVLFCLLGMNCWDEKIFSLLLNPCAPPGWKSCFQQDEIWDVICHRVLCSRTVLILVPFHRSQPGFGQTQPTQSASPSRGCRSFKFP